MGFVLEKGIYTYSQKLLIMVIFLHHNEFTFNYKANFFYKNYFFTYYNQMKIIIISL